MKYTPEIITILKKNEVFVFGSNEAGYHGAGAARTAVDLFGARMGQGFGMAGDTFAIPTKDWRIKTLPFAHVCFYVSRFVNFAKKNKEKTFLVTKIGCGLAGFKIEEIAHIFWEASADRADNIILPKEFADYCAGMALKDL